MCVGFMQQVHEEVRYNKGISRLIVEYGMKKSADVLLFVTVWLTMSLWI